jgi:uncharacterized protein YjbI with pentapeptide repeats
MADRDAIAKVGPGAQLSGADLSGANLIGANLSRASLSGASLRHAIANNHTIWPDGFNPHDAGVEVYE